MMESAGEIDSRPSRKEGDVRRNNWFAPRRIRRGRFINRREIEGFNATPSDLYALTPEEELKLLKQRAEFVSQRLEQIRQRIEGQKRVNPQRSRSEAVAIVDEEECTSCGLCFEVCPVGAISMNGVAKIDSRKCTACLACVKQCPQGAIAVKYPKK